MDVRAMISHTISQFRGGGSSLYRLSSIDPTLSSYCFLVSSSREMSFVNRLLWWRVCCTLCMFSGVKVADANDVPLSNLRGRSFDDRRRHVQEVVVCCHILQVDIELPELSSSNSDMSDGMGFVCWTENDQVWDIQVATLQQVEQLLQADGQYVTITKTTTTYSQDSTLILTSESEILPEEQPSGGRQRLLAQSVGTSLVLILRVIYKGTSPTLTSSQLAGRVFGLGSNAESINLVSQLKACSFHKLTLVAASESSDIHDGVLDVSITETVTGSSSARSLENLVVSAATNILGGDLSMYQHVMMVFPSHSDIVYGGKSFLAYGYVGGPRTVFSDQWAGRLSAVAHEFGHNMRLSHSGKGSDYYGDMSGFMGYGSRTIGGPLSCYNAQKHWDLGWMSSNAKALSMSDLPWAGDLAAFVDMQLSDKAVVLRIVGSNQRLFLQYNRKKGMNSGTRELGDQVVIIQDTGSETQRGLQSWQLGGIISVGATFRRQNFSGGYDLVIQVCNLATTAPEYVRLSIFLDNGSQSSTCGSSRLNASCTDSAKQFYVQEKKSWKSCSWLKSRPLWQKRLCAKGQNAYNACPKTCKNSNC